MHSYTMMKTVFTAAGVALMAGAGAAALTWTDSAWASLAVMLAVAIACPTIGRRALRACWQRWLALPGDTAGEETARYNSTTRGRHLARKLERLVRRAGGDVTVLVVGDEYLPGRNGRCRWTEALGAAAAAGARVRLYVRPGSDAEEHSRAEHLAEAGPDCRAIVLAPRADGLFDIFCPVVAWAGERSKPADALLWVEWAREPGETKTKVEYRDGRNLRREPGMLEEFAASIETSKTSGSESRSKAEVQAA